MVGSVSWLNVAGVSWIASLIIAMWYESKRVRDLDKIRKLERSLSAAKFVSTNYSHLKVDYEKERERAKGMERLLRQLISSAREHNETVTEVRHGLVEDGFSCVKQPEVEECRPHGGF